MRILSEDNAGPKARSQLFAILHGRILEVIYKLRDRPFVNADIVWKPILFTFNGLFTLNMGSCVDDQR